MANWGELPLDVAIIIIEKLCFYEEILSFPCVCNSWRRAAKLAKSRKSLMQAPWLMLMERGPRTSCTSNRWFYSIYDKMVRRLVNLPDLSKANEDTCNSVVYELGGGTSYFYASSNKVYSKESKIRYFSSNGWLICVTQIGLNVILMHPFTGRIIRTPTLPVSILQKDVQNDQEYMSTFFKFALSECPLTTRDYTLAMIVSTTLAFWRSTDNRWTRVVNNKYSRRLYMEVYYYEGEFYAIRKKSAGHSEVVACGKPNPTNNGRWTPRIRVVANKCFPNSVDKFYLVGVDGILLLVTRKEATRSYITNGNDTEIFHVWEVNFEDRVLKEVHNVGNRALFVGFNSSFYVDSNPAHTSWPHDLFESDWRQEMHLCRAIEHLVPSDERYCTENCIYYTDELSEKYYSSKGSGRNMGVYCLTSRRKKEDSYKGNLQLSIDTTPLWVELPKSLKVMLKTKIKLSQNY